MGVIRDFYNLHSFFYPKKVMKFAFGLFLNEISNFLPFFSDVTYSGHKMKYAGSVDMFACFFTLIVPSANSVSLLKIFVTACSR